MIASAISTERGTGVSGPFLAGVAVSVMLPEIMRTTASRTNENIRRASRTRVAPGLTLIAERLRGQFHPTFTGSCASGEVDHGAHQASANIPLIVVDHGDDHGGGRHSGFEVDELWV